MIEKSIMIKMRINASGYQGQPVSVMAGFDPATDVLLIFKESVYETTEREGWLRVSTSDRDAVHDLIFVEDNSREAIVEYFELDAMGLVQYGEGLTRLDPKGRIERDGMDEAGMKYRIHPDITNGQVAVLIAAFTARAQRNVAASNEFFDSLMTI